MKERYEDMIFAAVKKQARMGFVYTTIKIINVKSKGGLYGLQSRFAGGLLVIEG